MVVREETHSGPSADAVPVAFRAAVAQLHAAELRPEVFCEEMPAPQRIAPYASALSADVTVDDSDVGTGRLILLHDPDGNEAWGDGTFRCVAYVRAEIDVEQISDEMLGEVGWSWLTEALESHGAHYIAASGSVTRVATESFGAMADTASTAQIEIRASWTPALRDASSPGSSERADDDSDAIDVRTHVEAWGELLCSAAGLPPVPDGVAVIPSRRGQRGNEPR